MSKYPNTFYRVSVKALIKNDTGEVLVLKENQDTWSLPGGGLDHGEDPITGLKRELKEELNVQPAEVAHFGTESFYLESRQTWLLWVIFEAKVNDQEFTLGGGVTESRFIDPSELKDSTDIFERLVYRITTRDSSKRLRIPLG